MWVSSTDEKIWEYKEIFEPSLWDSNRNDIRIETVRCEQNGFPDWFVSVEITLFIHADDEMFWDDKWDSWWWGECWEYFLTYWVD